MVDDGKRGGGGQCAAKRSGVESRDWRQRPGFGERRREVREKEAE